MSHLNLPKSIDAYFEANQRNPEAFADCFTADAVVKDERQTHTGRAAIDRWRAETVAKYAFTSEPLRLEREGDAHVVIARVSGSFPGSPIELTHRFRLAQDGIAFLEIG